MSNIHDQCYLRNLFYRVESGISDYVHVSGTPEYEGFDHNKIENLLN